MSTVQGIEAAVSKLTQQELTTFRQWFADFDAAAWDRRFEADVHAGRLDALADEALADLHGGRCTDLRSTGPTAGFGLAAPVSRLMSNAWPTLPMPY